MGKKKTLGATVDRVALAAALKMLGKIVERRNTIPVLSNVAIRVTGDRLMLAATDLDLHFEIDLPCVGGGDFSTTTGAHLLGRFVGATSGEEFDFILTEAGKLDVACGEAMASLFTLPIDDLPMVDWDDREGAVEVNAAKLASDLEFCAPAISTEETRYYLNGVAVARYLGKAVLVATDGHRLHITESVDLGAPDDPKPPIVPTRAVKAILAMIAAHPNTGGIEIGFTANRIWAEIGEWRLAAKLIDGTYLDFTRVVPSVDGEATVAVGAKALGAATTAAASIASEKTKCVAFTARDGKLVAACTSPENGRAEAIATGSETSPFAFTIGFNADYVRHLVAVFGDAELSAWLIDAAAPALFSSPEAVGRTVVLMPMRV